jgi:hypothetical protein
VRSIARLRTELKAKSGHEFQNFFVSLLGELMEGPVEAKKLGEFDKKGVDAFILTSDERAIEIAVQCKGFEVLEYGEDQQRQCRQEIAKYKEKGPTCSEYWLVINRPIKERIMREELEGDLEALVQSGKVAKTKLLDQEPLAETLSEFSSAKLSRWADAKRTELFEYYVSRLQVVKYIPDVPFGGRGNANPVEHLFASVQGFFRRLREHQTSKYRSPPMYLVTSEFGFGKTSTLQALASKWINTGGHVIYAPAALLAGYAFSNASGLASSILDFLVPDDVQLSPFAVYLFRDTLRETLIRSKDWLLLIDGLDENATAFKANSLQALRNSIADLGLPAVLSARDELVETRQTEFFPQASRDGPIFERIRLMDWPNELIVRFVNLFIASQDGEEHSSFRAFRELIESNRYNEVYGDIPKRPLFLGMPVKDAWTGEPPERQLHRLYGRYFRQKFHVDRAGDAASGSTGRPSAIVDAFGLEETSERLIRVMQDVADQMLRIAGPVGSRSAVHLDIISEKRLREIAGRHDVPVVQIEDIAMHSLLQPAGRDPITHERTMRFAHRSFQDWFLARRYAETGQEVYPGMSRSSQRFLTLMRADLANGGSLP